jgi:hypothetical protein
MAKYLLTYDLHDKSKERDLLEYLEAMGAKEVAESSYVMRHDVNALGIVEDITSITARITLYVVRLSSKEKPATYKGRKS